MIRNYAYNIARLLEEQKNWGRELDGDKFEDGEQSRCNEKFDGEGGNQIQAGEREDAADGFESDSRFGIANKTRETVRGS